MENGITFMIQKLLSDNILACVYDTTDIKKLGNNYPTFNICPFLSIALMHVNKDFV